MSGGKITGIVNYINLMTHLFTPKNSLLAICLVTFASLSSPLLFAEEKENEETEERGWFDNILDKLGADGGYDESKAIDFSILPGPFYNPDLKFGIGFSAAGLYKVDDSEDAEISSLTLTGYGSSNASFGVQVDNKMLFNGDRQRFFIKTTLNSTRESYYGTGYDQVMDEGNKTMFTLSEISVKPRYLHQVANDLYIGAGWDFSAQGAGSIDANEKPTFDPHKDMIDRRSSGVTAHVSYDSRDFINNPFSGSLFELDFGLYRKGLGGQNNFETYGITYSHYHSLAALPGVLAFQAKARFSSGDVPWTMMARMGGANNLRGYLNSRYRARNMMLSQVEYRLPLAGRHGMVFWTGAGTVANKAGDLSFSKLLPTVGIGYRFEVKQRTNLRLDFGIGKGDSGFYFNVNEAF